VGSAILGNVGTAEHQSFTVVGDTVNVAFRLEPLSKTCEYPVIVSGEIAGYASGGHEFKALGQTEVKGRREPVSTLGFVIRQDAGC
jgi:adenylate cyclase